VLIQLTRCSGLAPFAQPIFAAVFLFSSLLVAHAMWILSSLDGGSPGPPGSKTGASPAEATPCPHPCSDYIIPYLLPSFFSFLHSYLSTAVLLFCQSSYNTTCLLIQSFLFYGACIFSLFSLCFPLLYFALPVRRCFRGPFRRSQCRRKSPLRSISSEPVRRDPRIIKISLIVLKLRRHFSQKRKTATLVH